MNASQSKALLGAARKAHMALAGVYPDLVVTSELAEAIRFAGLKLSAIKCCFCEKPVDATDAMDGFSKKLKPAFAHEDCGVHFHFAADRFAQWCDSRRVADSNGTREEREALRNKLNYCACSHASERHAEDANYDRMACQDCSCDHFHYPVTESDQPVVTLDSADMVIDSNILDKVRKLQALTVERGATPDEAISAANRLSALIYRYNLTATDVAA